MTIIETNEFDYSDVTFDEYQVTIPGGQACVLRQASGEAVLRYRQQIMSGMSYREGKMSGSPVNMAASEPLLVHLCLFDVETNKNIKLSVIKSWPYRVMKALSDKAKDISDIDDKKDDDDDDDAENSGLGNELDSLEDGSD